jgi:hypothetical protein
VALCQLPKTCTRRPRKFHWLFKYKMRVSFGVQFHPALTEEFDGIKTAALQHKINERTITWTKTHRKKQILQTHRCCCPCSGRAPKTIALQHRAREKHHLHQRERWRHPLSERQRLQTKPKQKTKCTWDDTGECKMLAGALQKRRGRDEIVCLHVITIVKTKSVVERRTLEKIWNLRWDAQVKVQLFLKFLDVQIS